MTRSGVAVLERTAPAPSWSAGAMGKTDHKRVHGPAKDGPEQEGEALDNAFDLWLRRGLHQLYDTVAKEPIPEELLRMIEEDRAAKED